MPSVRVRDMTTASTPLQSTDLIYIVQGTSSGDRKITYSSFFNPSGVTAGSYGDATHVANVVVNASGFVTFATNTSIGGGTVTSVGMTVPSFLQVAGSPITTSGTLAVTLTTETANTVFAGPASGGAATPTFRALVATDLPGGVGTVTSVGLSLPAEYTVSGSPVTTSGTLTAVWKNENTNFFFAGTSSGASTVPSFRAMVNTDLPDSGVVAGAYGDSG